jgi:nitrate/nitrite-specific signal transduction histidine kinase
LVLEPLYHLRDVSDAITHGDVTQRATIESEDEFRELADSPTARHIFAQRFAD